MNILPFGKRDTSCDWCKKETDEGSFHPALVDIYTREVLGYMFLCDGCLDPESFRELYGRVVEILEKEGYL